MEQFKICSEYPAVFTAERNLLRHRMSQHTEERPSVCKDCGATFRRIDDVRSYIKDKHFDSVPILSVRNVGSPSLVWRKKHWRHVVSV